MSNPLEFSVVRLGNKVHLMFSGTGSTGDAWSHIIMTEVQFVQFKSAVNKA